jgi:hypothetical protein
MKKQNSNKKITVNRYEEYLIRRLRRWDKISPALENLLSNKKYCDSLSETKNMVMAKYLMLRGSERKDYEQDPVYQKIEHLKGEMLPRQLDKIPDEIRYYYAQFIDRNIHRETYEKFYNLSPELLKLRFALLYGCRFRDDSPKDL